MTGWYLVWILVIRTGIDFHITDHERIMPSLDACRIAKIELETEMAENPVSWGDFTSFSIRCERREDETQ